LNSTILIVDDEPAIRRLLRTGLGAEGYKTDESETGAATISHVREHKPDLVILDLGLPDMDGLDVLRAIRAFSAVPVVVLSAREDERGKVAALDLGADDYVTKPFGMAELMARVRTGLRHRLAQEGATPIFRSGDLSVDLVRRLIKMGERDVHLSPREYEILKLLVLHAGRVLTHRFILGKLWGAGGDAQQLRVYVRLIRQKLEANPEQPRFILTETGVGYRLAVLDEG
jgi:two-component system KDP operon response regulator KdpE